MTIEANLIDILAVHPVYTPNKEFGGIKIEGENSDGQLVFIYVPSPITDKLVDSIVKMLIDELENIHV